MRQAPEKTLSAAKLALAIRRLREERGDVALLGSEPIAIVGIGCRFPGGVRSPLDFWKLLHDGVDAISTTPPERWKAEDYFDPDPQTPGKTNTRWGGFLADVDTFDPMFFGITPREAASMDPQQRLALEVAWEAIWDSGHSPESLGASDTGVFVAVCNSDYERLVFEEPTQLGSHSCSGTYQSVASGRISFLLNLQGPSISVDTACSSSLVAIHLACQSLRAGECSMALAGGVMLHLLPEHYVGLAKLGMLSPDGRCKTFDAQANGFVPSDGCGMVLLRPLADALQQGDSIYAVLRGTALNQDGHTSVLTAPNGLAQQAVIAAALQNAQVSPSSVSYVETHGTGTPLGDPIEVEALTATVGRPAPGARPCALGALKTNLGHMEAAAGVGGLIKAALALQHEEIPPNLHFSQLNSNISLEGTRFLLPTEPTPWRRNATPRFAGVSSFGFSGTNAHVILEEAPLVPVQQQNSSTSEVRCLLPISARTPAALLEYARRYSEFLERAGAPNLHDICTAAATGRDHYEERLAVVGASRQELAELLREFAAGKTRKGMASGRASLENDGVVFVFSGQGSQWAGMGNALYESLPVFRSLIDKCETLIHRLGGWSLKEKLFAKAEESELSHTVFAQPAIFAIEVALAELWKSWGIIPAAVIGHSAGEVAAAHVAGVLDLEEAVRVVVHRGRLMEAATGMGRMAAVHLPAPEVRAAIAEFGANVSIGAINSPESTVISGDPQAVETLLARWQKKGIGCRPMPVDYAFHSEQMQPFSEALAKELGPVAARKQQVPLISTVYGRSCAGTELGTTYWAENVRRPVLFAAAVEVAAGLGLRTFLEVGPHPVLLNSVEECLAKTGNKSCLSASLRRNQDEMATMLGSLAALYVAGCPVKWDALYSKRVPRVVLPSYPYQRQRYWIDRTPRTRNNGLHPLLGVQLKSPAFAGSVFETPLSASSPAYLADHEIEGSVLLPMTAILEMANSAVRQAHSSRLALSDLTVTSPLVLSNDPRTVQTIVDGDKFRVCSLSGEEWTQHASGSIVAVDGQPRTRPVSELRIAGHGNDIAEFYSRLAQGGCQFGPAFHTIAELVTNQRESFAHVRLQEREARDAAKYTIHPALLDGCLQSAVAIADENSAGAWLPFAVRRLEIYENAGASVWAQARVQSSAGNSETCSADIDVWSEEGRPIARFLGVHFKRREAQSGAGRKAYRLEWRAAERTKAGTSPNRVLIVADDLSQGERLAAGLAVRGCLVEICPADGSLNGRQDPQVVVRLLASHLDENPAAAQRVICGATLALMQELITRFAARPPQLWLVTRDVVSVTSNDRCHGLAESTIWGFGRTVARELPDLRCVRVDLDRSSDFSALAEEIMSHDGEPEIAFRDGKRYVSRLQPLDFQGANPQRLTVSERGSMDRLVTRDMERRAPSSDEVEIEPEFSALNFRDVLNVLGMYPGDPGDPGFEFCGKIVRTGEGVQRYQAGDRVMGVAWHCLASYVNTPASLVMPVPKELSASAAATLPNAFLTAHYCLNELGKIKRGDRVLIHAATGGVGLAAVQLAQRAGAEIFATAGSDQKRAYLRSCGLAHIYSSRTTDFAREILEETGAKGVDLVLNSLAGDFITAGFDVLADGGCFIEMGKNAIWSQERVRSLDKSIRYFVVDLAEVIHSDPAKIRECFEKIATMIADRAIAPLPATVFDFRCAQDAFSYMAQAKHIGKVLLRHPAAPRIESDATYLITGGLGAIGIRTAAHLVDRGARNIVLVGRGVPSGETLEQIARMQNAGARVEVRAADVSRRREMEELFTGLRSSMPPLRGVIHSAGIVDDGVLSQQNWGRFEAVFAAKIAGAWNLHELTAHDPLDFFILFSSVASVLGSPSQASYSAGNAFLDALAHYRQSLGLPALSLNWGAWAEAGMAARVQAQGRRRVLSGVRAMTAEECLGSLDLAMKSSGAQVMVADVDWSQFDAREPMLSDLTRRFSRRESAPEQDSIVERLQSAPSHDRRRLLVDYLREQVRRVVGLDPSYFIDERQPLLRMGLDSLMAVEFRNQLSAALKKPLPATLLFDYPTLGAVVDFLSPDDDSPSKEELHDEVFDGIAALSDAEAEELLKEELRRN